MKKLLLSMGVLLVAINFVLAKKMDDKVLKVATAAGFKPLNFYNEKNKLVGFDIDIMNAIAKKIDYKIVFEPVGFDALIPALLSKKIDIVISSMSITEARKEKVNFSLPYYTSSTVLLVNKNNNAIKGFYDLDGKIVGVNVGTTQAKWVEENVKTAKIIYSSTPDEMFLQLTNKKVDAVLQDKPIIEYFVKNDKKKQTKIVGKPIMDNDDYGIAINKDNPELLEKINGALNNLKSSGEYGKIYDKWFK